MILLRTGTLIALLTSAAYATGTPTAIDCDNLADIDQYGQLKLDEQELIGKCINEGYDPPLSWRPPAGRVVTSPGAGTTLTQNQSAPPETPSKAGAPASVSNTKWGISLSLPPWQGFPCQLPGGTSICGGSSGGSGSSGSSGGGSGGGSCPARDDGSATFGERITLSSLPNRTLTCGGAVSLTGVPFTTTPNANRLVMIGGGAYEMKVFELVPTTNQFELKDVVPLPQYLCRQVGTTMQKSVDLRPPVSQIFAYSGSTTSLSVRLEVEPGKNPFNPFDPDTDALPEKYLIVPIEGGLPKNLTACEKETDYYKSTLPLSNAFSVIPSNNYDCNVGTLYPSGASCSKMLLITVADEPELVHQPGVSAQFTAIKDFGEVMTKSSANSVLNFGEGSLIRISTSGLKFTLPDGGVIPLRDGNYLTMSGSVDIMGGTLTLHGGGEIDDASGKKISDYSAGATVTPNADFPYLIKPRGRVGLPDGLVLPGKSGGYLRLPVATE